MTSSDLGVIFEVLPLLVGTGVVLATVVMLARRRLDRVGASATALLMVVCLAVWSMMMAPVRVGETLCMDVTAASGLLHDSDSMTTSGVDEAVGRACVAQSRRVVLGWQAVLLLATVGWLMVVRRRTPSVRARRAVAIGNRHDT